MKLSPTIVVLGLMLTFLSLTACNQAAEPEGTELSFQSVERYDWAKEYQRQEPGLMIVKKREDLQNLFPFVFFEETRRILNDVDFDEAIIVGIFQGRKSSGIYGVIVESVTQQDDIINIYATFIEPKGTFSDASTSPYEIIIIEQIEQEFTKCLTFNLIANNESVQKNEACF